MSRAQEYRSVPLRRHAVSPNRRLELEIALKQPPASDKAPNGDAPATNGTNGTREEPSAAPPAKVPSVNLSNIDELGIKYAMNSPRSLHLCNEFGVHPDELVPRPLGHFKARGVADAVAAMRYEHFETRRKQKLDALRRERDARLANGRNAHSQNTSRAHSPSASAATEEPGRRTPLSLIPRYTQDLLTRLTSKGSATDERQRSARAEAPPRPPPHLRHVSSAPAPTLLAETAALREERARQLIEKDNRRRLVYERAQRAKEERQFQSVSRQIVQQQRSEHQLKSAKTMRMCALEEQRLRREDTLNSIRMKRRQDDVLQTKVVRATVRSSSADPRDRYQVQLAKSMYLTPRQRSQRARSASATRSATPMATPRQ